MGLHSAEPRSRPPRWRTLLLAALVLALAAAILAGLWQLPRLSAVKPTPLAATLTPVAAAPTAAIAPTPVPTAAELTITSIGAEVNDLTGAITFTLAAVPPPGREIAEAILWYDTQAGQELRRFPGPLPAGSALRYRLDAAREGLTATLSGPVESPLLEGDLDYWWLVRDSSGATARDGGTAALGPALCALVATPVPEPAPLDFTWAVSESPAYQFAYVPGSAAERDLAQIRRLADAGVARAGAALEIEPAGQVRVYLVPRVFWQGGATYGEKVMLISYLDRNYTAVEPWSYFSHEGTHALAQDLLQPKEEGGPTGLLVEGLALWATSGHYRLDPLDAWAAVLAASDDYIPLSDLRTGPFYQFQHETSYLEAGSFVKFLIERYGWARFKELYGLETGKEEQDELLVQRLYGQSYADLEAAWLAYLDGLEPTAEQASLWRFRVRFFDLMRRYQTELDADARILPDRTPPEWTSDTLKIFLHSAEAPLNLILETAFIAAQERVTNGDLAAGAALLDDIEAALDGGGTLDRPALVERQAILGLLAHQDRAVRRADVDAYRRTLDSDSPLAADDAVAEALRPAYTVYRQELVRLDVTGDGQSAQGTVLLHAATVDGAPRGDGQLFAVAFAHGPDGWQLFRREPSTTVLLPPLPPGG